MKLAHQRPERAAYGRVTDPERYRAVVDDARALIDELVASWSKKRP
jgi:hypothetical protein